MAQQTAVEWLLNNMPDISHYIPIGVTIELHAKFQAAERMHKEQAVDAYKADRYPCSYEDAEHYYNETFGKQ